jgi:RNA polymerase sigma factor (sigma-70 family)
MSNLAIRRRNDAPSATEEFERVYRDNVSVISAFFERRCRDPQEVADLTSETFVEAIRSFTGFDSRRGTVRGWLFGIARHRYAQHCERSAHGRALTEWARGVHPLADDVRDEIESRIDAQRAGRLLMAGYARLSELDQSVLELVDLAGLTPTEAASVLDIAPTTLRVRLFRARGRLRKELTNDQPL